jgi:hypothetical protein
MNSASVTGQMNLMPNHAYIHYSTKSQFWEEFQKGGKTMPELTPEERDNIHELLDRLTIEQKKDFLAFLRALQAQAQAQEQQPTTASQSASEAAQGNT